MFFKTKILFSLAVLICSIMTHAAKAQVDPFSSTMNFESSGSAFAWRTSNWSECNGVCFTGDQARNVECQDNTGAAAPSADACNHSEKPATQRTCELPPCVWVEPACRGGSLYQTGSPQFEADEDQYWTRPTTTTAAMHTKDNLAGAPAYTGPIDVRYMVGGALSGTTIASLGTTTKKNPGLYNRIRDRLGKFFGWNKTRNK